MKNEEIREVTTTETQNVSNYIDNYCERNNQPDFFAEPLNLITNIFFIIGAILAFRFLQKNKQLLLKNWDIIFLIITLAAIGFGSGAFHSVPNQATLLMDVIPIGIFMHLYIVVFFRRVVGLNMVFSVAALIAFIALGMVFQKTFSPETLNGTIMYVPAYSTLILMVLILCFIKQSPLYLHLIYTAVIWTFSLAFRTMDMDICSYTGGVGTHFLWHTLNAIVLYRLIILLIKSKVLKQQ
jgi:hypothetical protein